MRYCTYKDCTKTVHGRGLCKTHYSQAERGVIPMPPKGTKGFDHPQQPKVGDGVSLDWDGGEEEMVDVPGKTEVHNYILGGDPGSKGFADRINAVVAVLGVMEGNDGFSRGVMGTCIVELREVAGQLTPNTPE
jgi:hypothetical protein